MVYYAYAKNSNDDWSWRYVIVAPSYDILNEWYEAVRARVTENVLWRVSEDFYVFDRTKLNLGRSTAPGNEAPQFMNKIIFQLQNDNEGRGISTFNNHWSR
ncbi:hypothetical protein N7499_009053 [Penicillium canescens]|uniref:PH domain-containing protein n=2 Tax=Penicillium TaxID=5073 RepID=A0A1F5LA66_PENAI|nr:hypothetical protein PENARI_c019G11375 [Penicillium arizonense]XP_058371316.1 uncharacterized protein N7446_008925 [Penicillium canescens]KAJ5981892.1 hypothetical protein N7522_013520 [Penicillium canescens]KAJ6032784.1 hypothetical protein N7444_010555 [Penicillium canescens]KAJ6058026.1 hypothetical protein N7460_001300 [Penicillium canescens]KAJ6059342.1 hypothetical protein N7446_008925 [Penicillium canescens]KAJ6071039.1 hypothetical protein N7499_009053 [Penicillium canescens]